MMPEPISPIATIHMFTTYDVTATLTPDPAPAHHGWHTTEVILVVDTGPAPGRPAGTRRHRRFGLGFIGAEGAGRREYGGPETPGPHAYVFIPPPAADGVMGRLRVRGLVIDAVPGDRLIFQGSTYVIEQNRNDSIVLTPVMS